ncbi:NADPH:quinone oxidoreductase family protein [Palleronia sp. KMU-117]|uniref:NADPH:quinone oxidoreductase family protein n=1 Tax=Palleronia sp. KMU-117 TaxID=3434108 RepID=UPI003D756759
MARRLIISAKDAASALVEGPDPSPGPGQVAIRVAACGLNFADLLMISGQYQDQPPFPLTPGMEIAGTVAAAGPGVDPGLVGRRVAAFPGQGGLAEVALAPADRLVPLADHMPMDEAAAMQVAYGTSHLALLRTARLKPGETLLVLGAAGGVGLTAVEIGAMIGARVIASARGPEKGAIAAQAGAQHVLDSDRDDLTDAVRALGGADVVYDAVGGPAFRAALSATRPEGRILLIGFASGTLPDIRPNHLLVKNVSVHGFYWGGYLSFAPDVLTDSLAEVFRWRAEGRISPHISHRFPLERADEALALLKGRGSTGKVVVLP